MLNVDSRKIYMASSNSDPLYKQINIPVSTQSKTSHQPQLSDCVCDQFLQIKQFLFTDSSFPSQRPHCSVK